MTEAATNWTREDALTAQKQGWDIFYTCKGDQLERCDEMEKFGDDSEAWEHVYRQSEVNGDALCAKALNHLKTFSPSEYAAIVEHCTKVAA